MAYVEVLIFAVLGALIALWIWRFLGRLFHWHQEGD